MRSTLLKIVLVSLLVLSLFILLLKVYFESYHNPGKVPQIDTHIPSQTDHLPVRESASVAQTSVEAIQALEREQNSTLEKSYKSVASEIRDFVAARQALSVSQKDKNSTSDNNQTLISQCKPATSVTPKSPVVPDRKETKRIQTPKVPVLSHKKSPLPRVVIIMDDVRSLSQAKQIRALPVKITPSIFPVTSDHPDTRKVAKMFSCYMVHTPMEAYHYPNEEENTLKVHDSMEVIEREIARIKRDFPDLTAINNHTGSKFTATPYAMDRLFCVLQKYGIAFVDSRTSAHTSAKKVARVHGVDILSRDVFLDNIDNVDAILARLRETVAYAKRHGRAIAICHPKPETFEALRSAKKILKGVEVVTLDKLYQCVD